MLNLIKIESKKMWMYHSSKLVIIILIVISLFYYFISREVGQLIGSYNVANEDWRERLVDNNALLDEYENNEAMKIIPSESVKIQKEINQFRLDNNIKPTNGIWDVGSNIINNMSKLFVVFIVIQLVSSLGNEYETGTMRQIITKPYKRWKLILSKYISFVLYGVFFMLVLAISSIVIGIIFGNNSEFNTYYIGYYNDEVIKISSFHYLMISIALNLINILVISAFSLVMCVMFRSKVFSLICSLIIVIFGETISNFIIDRISIFKYLFISNLNLLEFLGYNSKNQNFTLFGTIIILIVNTLIMIAIPIVIYNKQDIT